MNQKLMGMICVFFLVFTVNKTNAVEALSAVELKSHCVFLPEQTESVDGQFCIRYIQGFIDGAVATDERVLLNVEAELEQKETFTERATRVRGVGLRDRAARYAEFCLGDPVSLREVVSNVVDDLKATKLVADAMARNVVYTSVRKHYPCDSNSNGPR